MNYPSDITVTKVRPNRTVLSRWPTEEEKGISSAPASEPALIGEATGGTFTETEEPDVDISEKV